MRPIDADALIEKCGDWYVEEGTEEGFIGTLKSLIDEQPTVDAAPVVRCRDCRHKKLDGPSACKGIVNEFYCDEKLEWRYQYEGEPDILDWFCADGEAKPNAR